MNSVIPIIMINIIRYFNSNYFKIRTEMFKHNILTCFIFSFALILYFTLYLGNRPPILKIYWVNEAHLIYYCIIPDVCNIQLPTDCIKLCAISKF